jgi:hypothetical protein
MNRNLRKAVLAGLGIAALAGVSSQASAQNTTYAGTVAIGTPFTTSFTAGNNTWDGKNNPFATGLGWGHNAKWVTFDLASASKVDILLNLTNAATATKAHPAFTLYATTGYTDPAGGSGAGHTFSQVSTQSVSGWLADPAEGGATSVKGYANSGVAFNNYYAESVLHGGSTGATVTATSAELKLGLGAGKYLLALGGNSYNSVGGTAGAYALTITAAVPEPEEYLMMLLGGGMVGFQVKRKKAKQAAAA